MTIDERLATLPRVALLAGPTPLEHWPRLSQELGINLFVKRDDLMGIGCGGNKLRKLELILGKAKQEGASWLLTTGGAQSNHARLTAACAAKLGLPCTLMLRGSARELNGNLLLDRLFGAETRLLGDIDYAEVNLQMNDEAARLRDKGENPFIIPLGGATAEGTAGYVAAFAEILNQLEHRNLRPDYIVVAGGTGSTAAGLALGAEIHAPTVTVISISVSWPHDRLKSEIAHLIAATASLLGVQHKGEARYLVDTNHIGPGYAKISSDGRAAVEKAARSEGVALDTTYTGKAFAGLIDLVREVQIPALASVVFLHTGGVPELFTHSALDLVP